MIKSPDSFKSDKDQLYQNIVNYTENIGWNIILIQRLQKNCIIPLLLIRNGKMISEKHLSILNLKTENTPSIYRECYNEKTIKVERIYKARHIRGDGFVEDKEKKSVVKKRIMCPLILDRRGIGFIQFQFYKNKRIKTKDLERMKQISALISMIVGQQQNNSVETQKTMQNLAHLGHDFNNQLNIIKSYASLGIISAKETNNYENQENLQIIVDSVDEASTMMTALVCKLKDRPEDLKQENYSDLNLITTKRCKQWENMLGSELVITKELYNKKLLVPLSPSNLQRVIDNLIKNAIEAINYKGFIFIRVFKKENIAIFSISDNGPGIKEEEKKAIFYPFYTTKREKGGSGLGLSSVKEIITQAGGELSVSNNYMGGATFTVSLPPL